MCSIVSYDNHPQYLEKLTSWFARQWGGVDPPVHPNLSYPHPLFALDGDGGLIGGLSFTSAKSPETGLPAIWINAVFVSPESRGRGIASRLIRHAEKVARNEDILTIYVHSDVPMLYQRRGWTVASSSDQGFVLFKQLF